MTTSVVKIETPVQLGAFPGMKFHKESPEEEPPRLKIVIAITIEDRETGESTCRKIPLDLDVAEEVADAIKEAISHSRTLNDIASFCEGRNG